MTYSFIILVPRRPDLSPEAFKHHWETKHVPLLKQLVGNDFPLSHTRHYLARAADGQVATPDGASAPAATELFNYDGVAILTFANREHHERFWGKLHEEKAEKLHEEDLKRFIHMDGVRLVQVDETKATGRDGGMVGWRFVGSV